MHHQIIVYHNLAKTWKSVGTRTWYNVDEVDKIKGGNVLAKHIKYSIQPTDSVAEIAKRFGVDLHELDKLNPQVCTSGPQAGSEIMIPVDHLEIVPAVWQETESEDPGVQE